MLLLSVFILMRSYFYRHCHKRTHESVSIMVTRHIWCTYLYKFIVLYYICLSLDVFHVHHSKLSTYNLYIIHFLCPYDIYSSFSFLIFIMVHSIRYDLCAYCICLPITGHICEIVPYMFTTNCNLSQCIKL